MSDETVARRLDLCGEICPVNFVKTVLALEELEQGELLEVTLSGTEAITNLPRSVKQAGYAIEAVERLGEDGLRLRVRKG